MKRQDYNLPYLLKYENVAWYENGKVEILDRRIYPIKKEKVVCESYVDVAKAITDMVTQSAGPYTAVGMGMALAAFESKKLKEEDRIEFLKEASHVLSHARPTTANRMGLITEKSYEVGRDAIKSGKDPIAAIKQDTVDSLNRRYSVMERVAENLINLLEDDSVVLTQCYGETIIGMLLRLAKEKNKNIKFYCAETRPFFQGARLTASCCAEMGFDTTVVTDNMVAWLLENNRVDLFTSAADTITADGHIANKIGTYQIAILCERFNVPYYVTGFPDRDKKDRNSIIIEMRDPEQALKFLDIKITDDNVKGIYPSFDITPPNLIKGVVTDKGVYGPEKLNLYLEEATKFY
ncbi:methylthioribose-1-phosphate isomerase [Anaerosphaera aminiphila DSM 21120]|uniref:Methylthioribose-1-phosphate isomerase n=1 Tax=Anaerosphaera aminiphila DSM 21120 TaxID=1120995 RepID=A0A1M5PHX8_9FIRM|nr:S-methyl-5-thioribose-1-phosphate isomerase [Anaerosphaera aminiphila]SHH01375.1 methylthioribose-1-phosphate isomerase [Anaerosphaera aminiphila DSM 21120]